MTDEKLNEVDYQPNHLSTGGKAVRELHKITSIPKKDVKSWLQNKHFGKFTCDPQRK